MKKLILGIFLAVWWCGNHACAQDIAAKTNLLYWATTTPNIGMEFGLGEHIIGKTKCDGIQNQMRLFGGRVSPKRKATKISHTHTKKHRSNGF